MSVNRVTGSFGELNYTVHPGGAKVLLAFHGFGQDNTALSPILKKLCVRSTLYSFDHFFHGKSSWKLKDKSLSKEQWKSMLGQLFIRHDINSFDLLGFSLGAKVSLTTFEVYPHKVGKMYLLAPDGIQTSIWYNLATYPSVFRRYFKSMIVQPKRFYSILNSFHRLGLVDKGLIRFASGQMNTASKRHRVYYSWVIYREFKSSREVLIRLINKHECEVEFWLGKYDKVIAQRGIEIFAGQLTKKSIKILSCGHTDLISYSASKMFN